MKNTKILLSTKALRSFSVGFMSVILPIYLVYLGFPKIYVGIIFSLMIAVSATVTIFSHRIANSIGRKNSLALFSFVTAFSAMMMFLTTNDLIFVIFSILSFASVNGTDIGPIFSLENAAFSDAAKGANPKYFSIYSLLGGALLALGSFSVSTSLEARYFFLIFFLLSFVSGALFLFLKEERKRKQKNFQIPKSVNKKINGLATLFSIDSFGGGFVLQTLIAYFFLIRFNLPQDYLGFIFFIANILILTSYFFSYKLSKKIGLIRTMVFTHLPSNVLLILMAFAPTYLIAVVLYLLRMSLAEMDVPPRQAYTMMVVPKKYRNKAATMTIGTRMYSQAISPVLSGWLMQFISDGSPFIAGGALKIAYDLLLFRNFRKIKTVSN